MSHGAEQPPAGDRALDERRDRGDITSPFALAGRRRRTEGELAALTGPHPRPDASSSALHTAVAVGLTVLLSGWTVSAGAPPAVHPRLGAAMLVLHLGALLTAWLAYGASREIVLAPVDAGAPAPTPSGVMVVQVAAATAFLANCAMLVASVLA